MSLEGVDRGCDVKQMAPGCPRGFYGVRGRRLTEKDGVGRWSRDAGKMEEQETGRGTSEPFTAPEAAVVGCGGGAGAKGPGGLPEAED